MTLEEFQKELTVLYPEAKAEISNRERIPSPKDRRALGCGKVEVWVKREASFGRWGGGPTLDAAIEGARETLKWHRRIQGE